MKMSRIGLVVAGIFALATPASGRVLLDWHPDNLVGIVVDGLISRETRFEVVFAVADVANRGGKVAAYVLNSPGGSVVAALEIADIIRKTRSTVIIMSHAECASACFVILATADAKFISPDAHIGVHSVQTRGVGEDLDALASTAIVARLAAQYGVPNSIIGLMVRTPPEQIAWLTGEEVRSLPGTEVSQSVPIEIFLRAAVPVHEFWAGFTAGAAIARHLVPLRNCDFPEASFQDGCLMGQRQAPAAGWGFELYEVRP